MEAKIRVIQILVSQRLVRNSVIAGEKINGAFALVTLTMSFVLLKQLGSTIRRCSITSETNGNFCIFEGQGEVHRVVRYFINTSLFKMVFC
ncbi:hypothetical protein ACSVH5_10615 [Flavobacterium sp. RSSA_27]|uniref:hypothetical protein n=1 Tax=Flavobacterium sp. RSSA_27 TaxID=3447667 RepID=UPI003F3CCED7